MNREDDECYIKHIGWWGSKRPISGLAGSARSTMRDAILDRVCFSLCLKFGCIWPRFIGSWWWGWAGGLPDNQAIGLNYRAPLDWLLFCFVPLFSAFCGGCWERALSCGLSRFCYKQQRQSVSAYLNWCPRRWNLQAHCGGFQQARSQITQESAWIVSRKLKERERARDV